MSEYKATIMYETTKGPKRYYKVMGGLGTPTPYKARSNNYGSQKWTGVGSLPWRLDPAEAEADLKEFAKRHRLKAVKL